MKVYTKRTFIQLLKRNGFHYVRSNGSHFIYKNKEGNIISINKDINCTVARRLIKENNLMEV